MSDEIIIRCKCGAELQGEEEVGSMKCIGCMNFENDLR
jgi:hypothetical protein